MVKECILIFNIFISQRQTDDAATNGKLVIIVICAEKAMIHHKSVPRMSQFGSSSIMSVLGKKLKKESNTYSYDYWCSVSESKHAF